MNAVANAKKPWHVCKNFAYLFFRDLDEEEFESTIDQIGDDTLIRRARHAVSENQRTLKAKAELEAGNLEAFGQLLNDSHHSLRYDYEVTGIELDTLVDAAQNKKVSQVHE